MLHRWSISYSLLIIAIFGATVFYGQSVGLLHPYLSDFKEVLIKDGFEENDLKDVRVSHSTYSAHNGLTHVYLQQYLSNIPIHNAVANYSFKEASLYIGGHSLIPIANTQLRKNAKWERPAKWIKKISTKKGYNILLDSVAISKEWISKDNRLIKAYKLIWKDQENGDHWIFHIDATNGDILEQQNLVRKCVFSKPHSQGPFKLNRHLSTKSHNQAIMPSSYKVYPWPMESPNHGVQEIVADPADPIASPFGWHDVDGVSGADFTITRGNNVHAYQDTADIDQSLGDEPDGGQLLKFNFDHKPALGPLANIDADLTNLFYWNNLMHDWSYQFGFDEASGNFQMNNYGKGGVSGDPINAHALDGQDVDNATFSSPDDGASGTMQMFKWIVGSNVEVSSPATLAGMYNNGIAQFGPNIVGEITSSLIIVDDEEGVTSDACEIIQNANNIRGSIALIDRGICHFSEKVVNAQDRGAVACVICNNEPNTGVINMAAGNFANQVNIPAVFMTKEDCDLIKEQILQGEEVIMKLTDEVEEVSSSFDNGIVVHEYAHGLTDRLTGGASNSSCLNNDEQAGEGWSDFFALVMTHSKEDRGSDKRGIASYVLGQPIDGIGIRRYHYSTDMNINPQTHSHMRATSSPHALGEVWASVLWDMYWNLIDQYGYDRSWSDKNSGNYIAIQLVVDGLKLQPCNPSLIEARDAIIRADGINNNGINSCLLWKTFARRGFGIDAIGGLRNIRTDNLDGFKAPLSCLDQLSIEKSINPIVGLDDELLVILKVVNGSENDLIDFSINEAIPDGHTLIEVDDSVELVDGSLEYNIASLQSKEQIELRYIIKADGITPARFKFFEGFEFGDDNIKTSATVNNNWFPQKITKVGGESSYNVIGESGDFNSYLDIDNIGSLYDLRRPGLLFYHRYDLQAGVDGGIVEISIDEGMTWVPLREEQFLVNGYPDQITEDIFYRSLISAYTGETSWHPVLIDLSDYKENEVQIRFNLIGQNLNSGSRTSGWFIDNVEILEIEELIAETCINYSDGRQCIDTKTYISSGSISLPTISEINELGGLSIFPNPAGDVVFISLLKDENPVALLITNMEGRVVQQLKLSEGVAQSSLSLDVGHLSAGMYILSIQNDQGIVKSKKFIKN